MSWPRPPQVRDYLDAPTTGRRTGPRFEPSYDAEPLVTVVTPVFNSATFMRQSIDSVLSQTLPGVEYLVIDGGSTDGSLEIIDSYGDAVTGVVSEPDKGMYDAMNKGIALARGRYIKIHNADDVMPTDSARLAADLFAKHGDAVVVRGRMGSIDLDGVEILSADHRSGRRYFPAILHPTWYVPADVYRAFGLYYTHYRISSDYEVFFRLQAQGVRFVECPKTLSHFRQGGASSGLLNIGETFLINRHYQGPLRAGFVWSDSMARVLPRQAAVAVLGQERAWRMNTKLRSFLKRR